MMIDVHDVLTALRQPLQAFVDPAERVFIPAVLVAMGLVWLVLGRRGASRALRLGLWSGRIWLHRSSLADIVMLFARALILGALRIPWLAGTIAFALWVGTTLHATLGDAELGGAPPLALGLLYTVVLFVAWDFSRFALHWAMHRFDALWSFHQVHHSAEVLTPLTLYRVHPVESLLYDLRGLVTTGLVTGLFLYLFRGTAHELQVWGINAVGFAFNAISGNLRHSHVWLRFGRLERFFLSPAQHQLHHARDPRGHRSNYGTWLALWDRWLGTWRPAPREAVESFGLQQSNHRPDRVGSMLVGPFVELSRRFVPRRPRPRAWWGVAAIGAMLWPNQGAAAPTMPATEEPPAPTPTDPRVPEPVEPPAWSETPREAAPTEPAPTEPAPAEPGPSEPSETAPAETEPGGEGVDFELDLEEPAVPGPEADAKVDVPTDASPPAGEASDDSEAGADVVLDRVSIIGTPEAQARIGGSAFVVDEEELERKEYDDLHRALRSAPGVYLREEDGFGLRPNIGMRGANSDRSAKVTLMEDGILLAPAPYSAPAAYYFPLVTRVTGIEVFKGPASIRYGPNTIGGAVNLQTRAIPRKMEGYVDGGLGMRGYGKLHAYWGTTYKRFGVLVEGARIQSDGFKRLPSGDDTGFDKNDLMVKLRYASDPNRRWYHQVDVKGGFATERSDETYLGLTDEDFARDPYQRYPASELGRMKWWRSQAEAGYFVARGSMFDLHLQAYRHDFSRAWRKFNNFRGLDIAQVLAGANVGQTAVFAAILRGEEDSRSTDQALLIGTNDRRFEVNGVQIVTHVRPTWRWLEQDIEVGARVHHDQIIRDHTEDGYLMLSGQLVRDDTPRARTTNNRGTTVAGAFHVIDTLRVKWFSLMPGARVEVIYSEFNNRLTASEDSAVRTVFLPGVGAHAQATPWLGFLAGVHQGFSPVAPGQPDEVRPEKSINYEAGARVDHVAQVSKGAAEAGGVGLQTRAEAIGFLNDYSNLTSVCTFSAGCDDTMLDRQFNAGSVWVYGAELLAAERVLLPREHFVEGSVSYTYTGSYFRNTFSSASPQLGDVVRGDALAYVPEHLLSGTVGVGGRIWGLFPSVSYVGDMRDVAGQGPVVVEERIPAHYVVDLSGQVMPTKYTTIYLNIQNLTNNDYLVSRRPFGARPGMPFQLMAGFKVHFGGAS